MVGVALGWHAGVRPRLGRGARAHEAQAHLPHPGRGLGQIQVLAGRRQAVVQLAVNGKVALDGTVEALNDCLACVDRLADLLARRLFDVVGDLGEGRVLLDHLGFDVAKLFVDDLDLGFDFFLWCTDNWRVSVRR